MIDTYEEKYKGALARCKWLLSNGMISKIAATDMFRELMDNSENIRKEIINIFHSLAEGKIPVGINYANIFTWLEKQGKPIDKVEHVNTELEKQGKQEQLYIRFGGIPTDEKSKIYRGEIEVGTENGVSVYPAFKTDEGDIVLGLTLPITKTTLYTQQHLLEYDNRPCYLVKGDYVGKDTDGQPLINNVSIIEKIDSYRVKEEKADKVEPKFHEGDWTVSNLDRKTRQISEVHFDEYNSYYVVNGKSVNLEEYDRLHHLWTIQDAKDGDVLVTCFEEDNIIIMYHSRCTIDTINVHCCLDNKFVCGNLGVFDAEDVKPATKEQRDLLFQKMKEAGYEWDTEKKELKKIVKPKFKVGNWCIDNEDDTIFQIVKVLDNTYTYKTIEGKEYSCTHYSLENDARLWTIQDAKDGDVLVHNDCTFIFMGIEKDIVKGLCPELCNSISNFGEPEYDNDYQPATKEQRDTLEKAMADAGYTFNFEKKELKKIEDEEVNGEDYGIDGLWHAMNILEKTLGKVSGYQTDDGILEHKCAIAAVNKLYKQKPADKVEPKFKVGDWIYHNNGYRGPYLITNINEHGVELDNNIRIKIKDCSDYYHLWTIQDAKDGDVLASELCYSIILFRGIKNDNIDFYCDYDFSKIDVPGDRFTFNNGQHYGNVEDSKDFHPATKEQRDTLFAKMREAGYEWDAELKQLRKIEQKSITMSLDEAIEHCKEKSCGNNACALEHKQLEKWLTELKELKEQKPVEWSEEDEKMFISLKTLLNNASCYSCTEGVDKILSWVKSFRSQPKQEWSEEDETGLTNTIIMLKEGASFHFNKKDITKAVDFLKSLRPQNNWKPSEEQMDALNCARWNAPFKIEILDSLYNDLKKLTE